MIEIGDVETTYLLKFNYFCSAVFKNQEVNKINRKSVKKRTQANGEKKSKIHSEERKWRTIGLDKNYKKVYK